MRSCRSDVMATCTGQCSGTCDIMLTAPRCEGGEWDVMADVTWTGWSSIPKLEFVRSSGAVLNSVEYNWDDAWRLSVGGNYRYTWGTTTENCA